MRKVLIASLVMLVAIAGPVTTASAHNEIFGTAHNGNDGAHWWSTNGCTGVPDSAPGVFSFNHPCDHHDGCYGHHWASRFGCDNEFWSDMEATCSRMWAWWHPSRPLCRGVRDLYYAGVRAFGYLAYYGWDISSPMAW